MGYCRTTPREIIYGSKQLGGAEMFYLYDDQGYGQLKTFLKLWRSPKTPPGKLLRILLSWCQFCVGISTPVLQNVTTPLPHFESQWILSLRDYLKAVNGYIEIADTIIPPLRRTHDAFIMDLVFISHPKPAHIRKINYCRMYLNVVLLSDIVLPCGTRIDPAAYEGRQDLYYTSPNNQVHQA